MSRIAHLILALIAAAALASRADGVTYGGIEFPQGAISFADVVVSYDPLFSGGPAPDGSQPNIDPLKTLGIPDYAPGPPEINYTALGNGGRIVLLFDNNVLTGSGTTADDLYIFEVGGDVESTFVDISKNGTAWHSLGQIGGATRGIDIDAFGWGVSDQFRYVRLTDNAAQGGNSGPFAGADIDAVGAISTAAADSTVPEPASIALLAGAAVAALHARRHARR